jgi:hypothetical protein
MIVLSILLRALRRIRDCGVRNEHGEFILSDHIDHLPHDWRLAECDLY